MKKAKKLPFAPICKTSLSPNARATTPIAITAEIREFCRTIDPTREPVYVPVQAITGNVENFCWSNVKRYASEHGGELQHGWTIWETPGRLIEAEFHGVWRSPKGELIDITEKSDGEKRILYLPDSHRVFDKQLVENIKMPLVFDLETQMNLDYNHGMFALRQKYFNTETGMSDIPGEEIFAFEQSFATRYGVS